MRLKLYFLAALAFSATAAFAQSQYDSIRITYNGTKGNASCRMTGAANCYWYVGAATSGPNFGWEHIWGFGAWGTAHTQKQFHPTGTADLWTKTIHVYEYFGDSANVRSGGIPPYDTFPVQPGDTVYNIRFVFHNSDGTREGKDQSCQEFKIVGVNTDTLSVHDGVDSIWPWITAVWVTPSGIPSLSAVKGVSVFPNPSSDNVTVRLYADDAVDHVKVSILNVMGQELSTLYEGSMAEGRKTLTWDGTVNGSPVGNGIYFITANDGGAIATQQVMIMR